MRISTLTAFLLFWAGAAQAADVALLAPGLIGTGIPTLAAQWKAKTGNGVTTADGAPPVGKIEQLIASGSVPDLVILPPGEFPGMADKLKPGSQKHIGNVIFGVAVKSGTPHPDISTPEKFHAALQGKSVAYNNPAIGSLAGVMVDKFLKGPGYESVKRVPAKSTGGQSVADGEADIALATESEELKIKGIDIVGPVPDGIGLTLDISGAVMANAAHPAEAASFLDFLTTPLAATVWRSTGIGP